ncbi:hypothetical protein [Flavobacterium marginilacus]|uniref:hypothetical protein n=1 Tax=Flavobacterium marginilacus TaxID=3003256 RepID=UPI00248D78BF|nr:hypothetical protein [Flavobacterium marginilacus]
MKVIIPQQVTDCISKIGNRTAQKNGYKIYAALTIMSKRQNKYGYFPVPSTYLEKVNKRYKRALNALEEASIIKPFTRIEQHPKLIFESVEKRYYNVSKGICMKYKFLIDITQGIIEDVDFNNKRKFRWYSIIEHSMNELGYVGKISRDTFGRRVHHPVIPIYKEDLKNKGFAMIDAKCSQPKLLLNIIKEQDIVDKNYEDAFEVDFYNYLVQKLNLNNRQQAKDLFMYFLNSSGYVPNYKIHILFPIVSKFIKRLKTKNYKDAASYLQREEAKIWIDDLLENIPTDFALPIHDCLIVRDIEVYNILAYCKIKYQNIDFEVSFL